MAIPEVAVGGVVANVILAIFTIIIVSLRFYARKRSKLALKADDWLILFCLVCSLGLCVECIYAATTGLRGVHLSTLSFPNIERFFEIQFADALICHFVYGLIKLSVVIFYKRIFTSRTFNICANTVLGMISLYMVLSFFLFLFSAHPVAAYWNTSPELIGTQYNLDVPNLVIVCAAVDIFLDLAVLSLPFPVIKGLHMPTEKKLYVSGVFLLGAFCLISSCIRLFYSQKLFGTSTPDLNLDDKVYLWAHIEAYASTITACLPTLAPLLRGGRNLGSMIGSVRSIFSIRSKSSSLFRRHSSSSQSNGLPSPNSEKPPWNEDGPISVVTGGACDLESQKFPKYPEERILVQKSFVSAAGSAVN
ncbi:hypothetical protein SBOR_7166 [Sclerotinia borealis F-4128]|uniref:Rhodopsin domain-containing protein n=1 Tax=Sclerotinia borealis (strain F-4128) TaxID=1432307 RepID=W9CC91_SCLBF|nr:hypothetical protein SBOR_7166 [Sclerotinia borealis F-4128]